MNNDYQFQVELTANEVHQIGERARPLIESRNAVMQGFDDYIFPDNHMSDRERFHFIDRFFSHFDTALGQFYDIHGEQYWGSEVAEVAEPEAFFRNFDRYVIARLSDKIKKMPFEANVKKYLEAKR